MPGTDQVRVADVDRERVAARLARAHAEGRLTLAEYDERVRAAHGAVVGADLAPLTVDLPVSADRDPVAARPARSSLRPAVAVWAAVSAINVVIWVAVVAGTGAAVAPWWIWVAGPWGLVLAFRALAERSGLALPGPCRSPSPRR